MDADWVTKVEHHPKYRELVKKRTRFGWTLAVLMLIIYFSFIMTIAFAPGFLARPLSGETVMTVGIPIGLGVIISAFILTGIYVWRANTEFDRINNELKRDVL